MTATKVDQRYQELSLRALRIDHDLQSRVSTNIEVVREYSEALLSGAIFPPVTAFDDGRTYWLADGFHRCEAYRRVGRGSISAEVRMGTRREAIIFSAGANVKMGMRPTKEDIRKAIRMLLKDDEWRNLDDALIAQHCGTSPSTVRRYRNEWHAETGIERPKVVKTASGGEKPFDPPVHRPQLPTFEDFEYRKDEDRILGSPPLFVAWLHENGHFAKLVTISPFVSGVEVGDRTCVCDPLVDASNFFDLVGKLVLLRSARAVGADPTKLAIVSRSFRGVRKPIAILGESGFEFLTPAQFASDAEEA